MQVVPDSEKMVVSMMRSKLFEATAEGANEASPSAKNVQLGLVYTEDLPVAYK